MALDLLNRNQPRTTPGKFPEQRLTYSADLGAFIEYQPKPRFIRPIPFDWLHKCNRLGGKTTQVALALWFLAGVKQSMCFKLTQEAVDLAGCSRSALDHGLIELEKAGLIETKRSRGVRPMVRIFETTNVLRATSAI